MMRVLVAWWEGRPVGELTQDAGGDLAFTYGTSWLEDEDAPPLSASLPKRAKPYSRKACRPFFGGLLPEASQRKAAAQCLGISERNDFAMLDRLGGEVAGALQFLHPGERPEPSYGPWAPKALEAVELARILDSLPARPLMAGVGGLRLSLAGAQSKLPVILVHGEPALPLPGQPTTHILKPAMRSFPHLTENEAFAMRLAGLAGLEVAAVEPRRLQAQDGAHRTFLQVERYDREVSALGVRRLHQEDFCQALGFPVERKYQSEGGPSLADAFALLRRVSVQPAADLSSLLDAVIFNAVIGNADAHGKNFSLLHGPHGPRLAQLYDLLSTVVYPELSSRFAMKIGREAVLEDLNARAWSDFAGKAELGAPFVLRRVREFAATIREAAPKALASLAAAGLDTPTLEGLSALVQERAELCRNRLGQV